METIIRKIKIIARSKNLRNRLLVILGALVLFRLLSAIPIPGVDSLQLAGFLQGNQFFGLLNLFSGGGLSQLSIIMLGVGPYITASIIMQLMTIMVPRLKSLYHEEGEIGRKRFNQYSRFLTVPIAFIQGYGLLALLQSQGIISYISFFDRLTDLFVIVAGAMLITWIGERITEYGIGNGVSVIIFAGIISVIPQALQQLFFTYDPSQLMTYIGFGVLALIIVAAIVLVNESERPVPVTYAKRSQGGQTYGGTSTYIPLRINQAGVMPIIFALSILLFPQLLANFFATADSLLLRNISEVILRLLNMGYLYSVIYFVLVFAFTYFYTAITFEPHTMAENLQKAGGFIPGVRPGNQTTEYVGSIVSRITFIGAVFLGIIAVIPIILQSVTGVQAFAIGGTGLLIVVSVVVDIVKRVDAQVAMREY